MGGRRLRTSAPPEVEALKGVLVSRLQAATSETARGRLYRALTEVEKYGFAHAAGGTEQVAQLKARVARVLKGEGGVLRGTTSLRRGSTGRTVGGRPTAQGLSQAPRPARGGGADDKLSRRLLSAGGGSTTASRDAAAAAEVLAGGADGYKPPEWTLPPLVIERQGRCKVNEYSEIARREHLAVTAEAKARKAKTKATQASLKAELEKQMQVKVRRKREAETEKTADAAAIASNLARYLEEEDTKVQVRASQAREVGVLRRAQVEDNLRRQALAREAEAAKDRMMMQRAVDEARAEVERKELAQTKYKAMMRQVHADNIKLRETKLAAKAQEKEDDKALMRQYNEQLERQERARAEALEKIQAKQRRLRQMGEAMHKNVEEAAMEDERRAQREHRMYADREAARDVAKREKKKRIEAETKEVIQSQLARKRAVREREAELECAQAAIFKRQNEEQKAAELDKQRAARERNLTHRKAIERQIRGDAQRRYERATSKMTKDELLINKKLLA